MKAYKVDKAHEFFRKALRVSYIIRGGGKSLFNCYLGDSKLLPLTFKQQQEAIDYWFNLTGKRINTRWHQLFYSKLGEFKPSYMPFEIYGDLVSRQIPSDSVMSWFDDKSLYRYFLSDFQLPYRIAECCGGVCYLPEKGIQEVAMEEVVEHCNNLKNCIIKPSKSSSAGIGVRLLNIEKGNVIGEEQSVKELFDSYKGNFVIERKIEESSCLSRLNPSSCNSLRIHTWRNSHKERCEFISAYVRIGRLGSVKDNASAGGITCQIMSDGKLSNHPCTVNPYQRIDKSDAGIELAGYEIEGYDELVKTAVKAHSCLPLFGIIGWDICMGKDSKPIVIEFNPNPDMRIEQLIFRDSCLLDKQEEIIKEVFAQ